MANHSKLEDYSLPLAVVIGAIIIGGSIIYSSGSRGAAAPAPTVQPTAQNQPLAAVDSSKVKMNSPYIGNPNAKLTVAYWYDYQCPFCQRAEQTIVDRIVTDYVNTGKVKVVFKDFQFLGADSQTIGQVGRAVWQVAPGKFYLWYKAMFEKQGRENSGWATSEVIRSITLPVLGATDTDKVMALAKSNAQAFSTALSADKAEGTTYGVKSTPSFVIGKALHVGAKPYEEIKAAIEAALK